MENDLQYLSKLKQLSTKIGIYQHGKFGKPDPRFGYALEDQARALIVAHEFKQIDLEKTCLKFITGISNDELYPPHYFYEDSRGFQKNGYPEEAYGLTLWALLSTNNINNLKSKRIIDILTKDAHSWKYTKSIAPAIIGLSYLPKPTNLENALTQKLKTFYAKTVDGKWIWFENYLTYANAILPWSMWEIAIKRSSKSCAKIAEVTTDFLINTCQLKGVPAPIGNKGWFYKGKEKALFDQQPVDAAYMVCCLEKAYGYTGNKYYLEYAKKWWGWFFGNNINKKPLIDKDFACFDGLTSNGVNLNQGAESNICFLMAYLSAKRLDLI